MPKRYLITIGSPQTPGLKPLSKVGSDIDRLKTFFTDPLQGYTSVLEREIPIGASSVEVRRQLEQWFAESREEDGFVVIYIAGHGNFSYGKFRDACLLFSDSDDRFPSSVIRISELFRLIFDGRNSRPENILLILDVCHGGALAKEGIAEIASKAVMESKAAKGLYIIGAATPNLLAEDGLFLDAWMNVYEDDAWEPAGDYWHIDSLVGGINTWFESLKKWQRADYYVNGGTGIPQFIKSRKRTRIRSYELENLSYWEIKARGIDIAGMQDWFFTGREHALQAIASWLQETETTYNCCIVTGAPGSGKSALLSRLLLSALPETRSILLNGLKLQENDPTLLRTGIIKVYFNAKGAYLHDLIAAIARQLEVDAQTSEGLRRVLMEKTAITGMIVDSLDEAVDPAATLELLNSFVTVPSVRLIIGSRRGSFWGTFQGSKKEIDLDLNSYFSIGDIEQYVIRRLKSFSPAANEDAIEQLAVRIAAAAQRSFLYARVVSRFLCEKIHDRANWAAGIELPESIVAAFGQDLQRFAPKQRQMVMDLLTPLAYAGGKGLPQKNLWATLASHCSGNSYSNSHIRELREIAGYYLIKDTYEDEVVYRLFHQTFADYIRNCTADEAIEEKMTEGLQMMMKKDENGKLSWEYTTEPYLRRHFATHAAHANMLDQYLKDLDFLLYYPSESLLPVITNLTTDNGKRVGKAYRRASHWLKEGSSVFLSQLMLRANEYGVMSLVTQIQQSPLLQEWKVGWGKWSNEFAYFVLVNAPESIGCVKTYEDPVLGPLVVCTHGDNTIRVWRMADGHLLREYTADPDLKDFNILYLSVCRNEDNLYIAIGYRNDTISVYLLTEVNAIAKRTLNESITAMALGNVDDCMKLIVSVMKKDESASILIFTATLVPSGVIKKAALNAIYSLTPEEFRGIPVIIAGGDHLNRAPLGPEPRPVKLWSLRDRTLLWECKEVEYGTFRHVYPFHYKEKLWIVAFGSISATGFLYDIEGKRTLSFARFGGITDPLMGYRINAGRLEILGLNYDQGSLFTVDLDAPELQFHQQTMNINYISSKWALPVMLFGRLTLINAVDRQVRIWDFEEAVEMAAQSNNQAGSTSTNFTVYKMISGGTNLLAGATPQGKLTVWDMAGNQLAEQIVDDIVKIQLAETEDEPLLVVLTEKLEILIFTAAHLRHQKTIPLQGIEAMNLYAFRHEEEWLALVVVKIQDEHGSLYIARLINLRTGNEILAKDKYGEFRFQMSGYEDKTLHTAVFLSRPYPRVAIAGPNGQIMAIRLNYPMTPEEPNKIYEGCEWELENYNYIWALLSVESDKKSLLIASDDSGYIGAFGVPEEERTTIKMQSDNSRILFSTFEMPQGASTIVKVHAHTMGIRSLLAYTSPKGVIILSASEDGFIHFWTLNLIRRYSIHIEHPIYDITLLGGSTLAVACSKGLVTIIPDWEKIIIGLST